MMKKIILLALIAFLLTGCGAVQIRTSPAAAFDIAITGDIMMGRRYIPVINEKGVDYPFQLVRNEFANCKIIFGNLEAPLIYPDKIPEIKKNGKKRIHLYQEEKTVKGIKNAGFNVLSLGNNHSID